MSVKCIQPKGDAIKDFLSKNYFESPEKFWSMRKDFEVSLEKAIKQAREECIKEKVSTDCAKFVEYLSVAVPKSMSPTVSESSKTYDDYFEGKHIKCHLELRWWQEVVEDEAKPSVHEQQDTLMDAKEFVALHKDDVHFAYNYGDDAKVKIVENKRQLWNYEKERLKKRGVIHWKTLLLETVVFPKKNRWLTAEGISWEAFQGMFGDKEITRATFYNAWNKYKKRLSCHND